MRPTWFLRGLADARPITAGELAARTGSHERYVRDWLEEQAVCDILECGGQGGASADGPARRYRLRAARASVLLGEEDLTVTLSGLISGDVPEQ